MWPTAARLRDEAVGDVDGLARRAADLAEAVDAGHLELQVALTAAAALIVRDPSGSVWRLLPDERLLQVSLLLVSPDGSSRVERVIALPGAAAGAVSEPHGRRRSAVWLTRALVVAFAVIVIVAFAGFVSSGATLGG